MMRLLRRDILHYPFQIGLADGKIRIPALPFKVPELSRLFLEPQVGDTLQLFYPLGLSYRAPKSAEHMNVILDSANQQRRTIKRLGNRPELGVELFTYAFISEKRPTIFGRKDKMDANGGKRLWHA